MAQQNTKKPIEGSGKNSKKDVGVLGAGLTGLTVAYKLSRKGHKVTLYEEESRVGGLCKTFKFNDQLYDLGPHEICSDNPSLIDFLQDLLGDDLIIGHKKSAQFFMEKFIDYPIRPVQFFRQMDKALILKIFIEIVYFRSKNLFFEPIDYSFKHWVENRFGVTMYDLYFKPYTEKVWGIEPGDLDLRTASDRIAFNGAFDILYQTFMYYFFKKEQYKSVHNPLKSRYFYCKRGIGQLTDRIYEQCVAHGCTFKQGWRVKKLIRKKGKILHAVSESGEKSEHHDLFVSTIPLTTLNSSLGHGELNSDLRFRGITFCFLEIPLSHFTPYHWIYFPEAKFPFQRICEFSLFSPHMAKEGYSGVCAEIACFENDSLWNSSDSSIIELVIRNLLNSGILKDKKNVNGWVRREKYAYPIQINGFLEHVKRSVENIEQFENLVATGRQGLYKYCNMNECMEMALELGDRIDLNQEFKTHLESKWRGFGIDSQ